MLLDQVLTTYHFNELHAVAVDAPPSRVLGAIEEVTLQEVPLFRLLFALRVLPARLRGRHLPAFDVHERFVTWARRSGFTFLGRVAHEELVFGVIGQPWRLAGGASLEVHSAEEFIAFATPGYVKVATNFWVQPMGAGRSTLSTETRIWAPDRASRATFARYWRFIRVGSAIIRREWLAAIKRRAEAHPVNSSDDR
jgi:hypothetical protein